MSNLQCGYLRKDSYLRKQEIAMRVKIAVSPIVIWSHDIKLSTEFLGFILSLQIV